MDNQAYLPIIIMLICGIIGGTTVHVTTLTENDKEKFLNINLLEKILYGIIASFLVPLFLNTISSSLMDEIETDIKSIFIFIGFCLIASLSSSKLFIKALTNKAISSIQQQQNDTNKRVDNINSAVETVVAKDMANFPIEIDSDKLKIEKNGGYKTLDFVKNKLLLQLGSDENTFFNKRSLAKKTDMVKKYISSI